jgi:hypothetical protein
LHGVRTQPGNLFHKGDASGGVGGVGIGGIGKPHIAVDDEVKVRREILLVHGEGGAGFLGGGAGGKKPASKQAGEESTQGAYRIHSGTINQTGEEDLKGENLGGGWLR